MTHRPLHQRSFALALAMLASFWLAGCGFHLRGSTNLAFSTLAVQGPSGPLLIDFKRQIASTTATRIADDPKQAQAIFTLLSDSPTQTAVAYNADGTVAQYQLRETVSFQLTTPQGQVLVPPTSISQTSSLSYSTSATLAKANEADLLYRGMRQDIVNRIMFQLSTVKRAPMPAAPASVPASAPASAP
jgi:LPS-assembly lipoprotein